MSATLIISANGTPTQVAKTVTTSSTALLAANTAYTFIKVSVPSSAANGIWVDWSGNAAVTAPPSEFIAPGVSASWTVFVPTCAINCIASASVAVTVVYK